ncbi:hypothetical protein M2475_001971 [Breznakia sp. PF5-3]|uniref:hypothetical protein n=1 Tax=unclassified Breznakia TaxID=2623764 RepID=UPI0024069FDD|nr:MULTISPECIES: hypothetical protein [unclassified Breznakia]MDF9825524.1 hypothetical protein [Breznakia sp. PM6-1]MDF9836391.1 hypothetical protein [Breznakia sp. PF5-3]MDF9838735.1 hypothetical protein [Breznakia sp. PFB2-8]MDF9860543.1 hypothetical protein [Breznakia sp. PH5-24]
MRKKKLNFGRKEVLFIIVLLAIVIFAGVNLWINSTSKSIDDSMMSNIEKKNIEVFYDKSPNLISYGENFDVKYVFYNVYDPMTSSFDVVMKGDKFIDIEKIKLKFCEYDTSNNCISRDVENSQIRLFDYNKKVPIRYNSFSFSDVDNNFEYSKRKNKTINIESVEVEIYYDGLVEKLNLKFNKNEMINLYKPSKTIYEVVGSYSKENGKMYNKGINEWSEYLHNLYYFDSSLYLKELTDFTTTIVESKYKKEILSDNTIIPNAFWPSYGDTEIENVETANEIYRNLKKLYYEKTDYLSSSVKSKLIHVINKCNDSMKLYNAGKLNSIVNGEEWDENINEYFKK